MPARSESTSPSEALSIREGIAHQDRVVALGTRGEQRHRRLDQLLDPPDVFDRGRGEIDPAPGAARRLRPSLHGFVDRPRGRLGRHAGGEIRYLLAFDTVANADLELRKAVQHVELCERDAIDSTELDRLAHHGGVEPAAAPLAAGD